MTDDEPTPPALDMSGAEFRRHADQVIDWIANYLDDPTAYPVLAQVEPGRIAGSLPTKPPEEGEAMDAVLADFRTLLLPGVTHWNHPGFFAFFSTSGSGAGILAEALIAALNVNAMLWRSSPVATELEEVTVDWLRQILGLPEAFRGHIQDSASTSTLVAIAAAREDAGLEIRERGASGRSLPALRLYCSEEAHSSVEKAAIVLGVGREGTRRIATDDEFRMRPEALEEAIMSDLHAGHRPFCVVATIGTTSTTSVDPVPGIAAIARKHGLWLHVDAAYGGAAALIPEMRPLMQGWEEADSIVVNPHKWLFVPLDCSVLLLRDPALTRRAFSIVPDYLATPEGATVTNLMDYGPALGRRFRSLKLWMTLRYFGRIGLAERIREHLELAALFASWVAAEPDWVVVAPVRFSTVCFRYSPPGRTAEELDRLNQRILDHANASGDVFLAGTRLDGRFTLRLAIGNVRTQRQHVQRAWELLKNFEF